MCTLYILLDGAEGDKGEKGEFFTPSISHSLSFLMTFLIDLAITEGLLISEWKEKYKWIEKRVLSSLFLLPSISL